MTRLVISMLVLSLIGPCIPDSQAASLRVSREFAFGQQGGGDGEFRFPSGVAVEASGNLLVTDYRRETLSRFSGAGQYLGEVRPAGNRLEGPVGVCVDPRGNIFVVEGRANRVQKLAPSGRLLQRIGRSGSAPGLFAAPKGVACDSRGHVFVADHFNGRIQELDNDGNYVRLYEFRLASDGEPAAPWGVGVDGRDRVYGVYPDVDKVCRFDLNGIPDLMFGTQGKANGQFRGPRYIAFDVRDNVYVSDQKNHRIQKFNEDGRFLGAYGGRGVSLGKFRNPQALALDPAGNIVVADGGNDRVQILTISEHRRHQNLGLHYYRIGEFEKAVEHYEATLKRDPGHKEALGNLVDAYIRLSDSALARGDLAAGKTYLGKVLRHRPNSSQTRKKLRSLVWKENRSEFYYPTVALGIILAGVFLIATFFRFVRH